MKYISNKYKRIISIGLISCATVPLFYALQKNDSLQKEGFMLSDVRTIKDAANLFPKTVSDINQQVETAIKDAQERIAAITTIEDQQRTYANTVKALDELCSLSNFAILSSALQLLEMVNPDKALREAARAGYLKLQDFSIDAISTNVDLYNAIKSYAAVGTEELSAEQKYFLDETLRDFKRAGLDLPQQDLGQVKQLKKEIKELTADFNRNIAQDATQVLVKKEDLTGLEDDFINNLTQTKEGLYTLTLDYPTYFAVMENCTVTPTRKKLYLAFENRAYPANDKVLKALIKKRDQLAKKLGFASYAALDLDDQMIKNPDHAGEFLAELNSKVGSKIDKEFRTLTKELPESVQLSENGKVWPWDIRYLTHQYKKKHLSVDETKLAEYFPMESTIKGLLDIYRQFLGVDFTEIPVSKLWHEDVKCIGISPKGSKKISGYIFLDLHPRPNKYTHACHGGVVPATYDTEDNPTCGVSILIANFPKSTPDKPALLKRSDVSTFFHEFGHAIHAQLGRTQHGCFAGTKVKTDFVEMPSQMLEEWLWDKDILKNLSCHYKTKDQLSDEELNAIMTIKNFCKGTWINRQVMLSQLSLRYFLEGEDKDPYTTLLTLAKDFSQHIECVPETHKYCSFGHLCGYGAKYYGYLWSKVFALDLFDTIKQHGLLDEEIGHKYVKEVLEKGGSQDPNELLENFLGRTPTQDAFLKDIGVEA